ncbi:MAG: NAD(P)-dependent oxidoreductase [Patescibacteria group bacterium]
MYKHIFITGAGGYIGSKMVSFFLEKGFFVTALDKFFFGNVLNDLKENKSLNIINGDIRLFDKKVLKNVDVVVDLAAISSDLASELNPTLTHEINCEGAMRVARLAKEMMVKKYIFSSSCNVYGAGNDIFDETSQFHPIGSYAISKAEAEKKLLKLADDNFTVTIMRNAPVYGLSERRMRFDLIVNIMTLHAMKHNTIRIFNGGKQWRPLIHINDCITAFLCIIMENDLIKIQRQIFNVGSNGQTYQMYEIAAKIKKYFPNVVIENVPGYHDKISYRADFDKIKNVLHFRTKKSIDDGIIEIKNAIIKGIIRDNTETRIFERYQYLLSEKKLTSFNG